MKTRAHGLALSLVLVACSAPTAPNDASPDRSAPPDVAPLDVALPDVTPLDVTPLDVTEDARSSDDGSSVLDVPAVSDAPDVTAMDAREDVAPEAAADVSVDAVSDASRDAVPDACVTMCAGRCVNLDSDVSHCGRCANACPTTMNGAAVCDTGACIVRCDPGYFPVGTRCQLIPAPRPIAPLSGRWVTSARPTLRWELSAPADGARVELCRDSACATVVTTVDVTGASARPSAALAPGVYFWRVRPRVGTALGITVSPAWSLVIPARPDATLDLATHQQLDTDNDGQPEALALSDSTVSGAMVEAHLVHVRSGRLVTSATPLRRERGLRRPIGLGDVNGDGRSDVLIDVPSVGGCVYLGAATGVPTFAGCSLTSGSGAALAHGYAAAAGDVNNDGYGDVIVSGERGTVFVRYGSSAGLGAARDEFFLPRDPSSILLARAAVGDFDANGTREIAVFRVNGTAITAPTIFNVTGGAPTDVGRRALSWSLGLLPWIDANPVATDVNGDGFQDLVIALTSNDFPRRGGRVVVFFGSATGLAATPSQIVSNPDSDEARFGSAFDRAGDLDGDGFEDVIVSSVSFTNNTGRVYVLSGSATGLRAAPAQFFTGAMPNANYGFAVAGLGPINGRTQSAVLFSAWGGGTRPGSVELFVNGGAPLLTLVADTAAAPTSTNGFGASLSSLAH